MSCAPFADPLLNALSYLHTKQVIDANMNIVNPAMLPVYLRILQQQTDNQLFTIEGSKLVVATPMISDNVVKSDDFTQELDSPVDEVVIDYSENYRQHVEALRAERKQANIEYIDDLLIDSVFSPDELQLAITMAENGDLTLQC